MSAVRVNNLGVESWLRAQGGAGTGPKTTSQSFTLAQIAQFAQLPLSFAGTVSVLTGQTRSR